MNEDLPTFFLKFECLNKCCKDLLPAPGNRSNETHNIDGRGTWQQVGTREERKAVVEKRGRIKERRRDDDESPDPSMSKIVLRNLIISSKYYKEEEAKELLEVITGERLETEQQ
ncbi:hypothetical protein TNCV_2058751 [Trichonephila clavipes]|nr:hypothetical protein TNCV_2058751 [Trichonephila clavipes]